MTGLTAGVSWFVLCISKLSGNKEAHQEGKIYRWQEIIQISPDLRLLGI